MCCAVGPDRSRPITVELQTASLLVEHLRPQPRIAGPTCERAERRRGNTVATLPEVAAGQRVAGVELFFGGEIGGFG